MELKNKERFDDVILRYLPHRPPMLLVNRLIEISQNHSIAKVWIDEQAPFFTEIGVPAEIGIEYMGQTAALIAGFQLEQGLSKPHLGFLLGTRNYSCRQDYFSPNQSLIVECREKALVGDSLATFDCLIKIENQTEVIAQSNLSVLRKSLDNS